MCFQPPCGSRRSSPHEHVSALRLSLQHGFAMIDRLGGIEAIQSHVATLTEYLYDRMSNLRHSNGAPMVQIFGKHHFPNSRQVRVLAF